MEQAVTIDYTNYRGERTARKVLPLRLWFGVSPFHSGEQWFLEAVDVEKQVERSFACKDIHGGWQP